MTTDHYLGLARSLRGEGDCSVRGGAVLVKGDQVIAKSGDRQLAHDNPIATAEMECIRQAGRRNDQAELTLYTANYPDMLIAGTILQFSIGALVIGQPQITSQAIDLLVRKGVAVSFQPDQEHHNE